jgi:pyruvate/2-oxoglutarate dehydrogenase complex dihydrolipoamide acyltransferase (E2) component
MQTPVHLPDLGAAMIRVSLWYVDAGDLVYEGDRLLEVLTAGATFDVAAPVTGRLVECHVWPSDCLQPGQLLGIMEAAVSP